MRLAAASLRFAFRDLRSSPARLASTVLVLAASMAAMYAVRTVADADLALVRSDSRGWLGGDVVVITAERLNAEQSRLIDQYEHIQSFEALASATSDRSPDPVMVAVRAIDPRRYSFFSQIRSVSGIGPSEAVAGDGVIISKSAAHRLQAPVGAHIRLGSASLRVSAILAEEQDRLGAVVNLYPRVIVSQSEFSRSGIAQAGPYVRERVLFRVPAIHIRNFVAQLDEAFPTADVFDYRRPDVRYVNILESIGSALQAIGWGILGLGATGALTLMFVHIEQRVDNVAVLRSLGATNAYIVIAHAWQVVLIASMGGVLGLAAGRALAPMLAGVGWIEWGLPLQLSWNWRPAVLCASAGIAIPAALSIVPIAKLRRVPALVVLRRDVARRGSYHRRRWIPVLAALTLAAALLAFPRLLRGPTVASAEKTLPYGSADFVLFGLTGTQAAAVAAKLRENPATRAAEVHSLAKIRLGGQSAVASCANDLADNELRLSSSYAELLGLAKGQQTHARGDLLLVKDVIDLETVANVRRGIQLSCAYMERTFQTFYEIAVFGDANRLIPYLNNQFPTAGILRGSELRDALQFAIDRASKAMEYLSLATYLGAATVIAAVILSSRRRWLGEIAIRKALGATRRQILLRFVRQFSLCGMAAGVAGAMLAVAAATILQIFVFRHRGASWDTRIVLSVILTSTGVSAVAGAITVLPLVRRKPLALLREP